MFHDDGISIWHNRLNATYQVLKPLSIGPQVEGNWDFNASEFNYLPFGVRADVDYGKSFTLSLFPGYDMINELFSGRISLLYRW